MAKQYEGYHEDFEQRALECKTHAGNRCECCGVVDGSLGITRSGRRKGQQHIVYLQAAHLDRNDMMNPNPKLAALCPGCHGRYDHGTPAQQQMVLEAIALTRQQGP